MTDHKRDSASDVSDRDLDGITGGVASVAGGNPDGVIARRRGGPGVASTAGGTPDGVASTTGADPDT